MAKQDGLLKVKGTMGDITFYKSKDGYMLRQKGGVDRSRIANDDAFARTRENGQEFGSSATSGKLLRNTIRSLMMTCSDARVTARLTKLMSQIKNMDTTSARGARHVGGGIADPLAKALLKGFNFNLDAALEAILVKPYTVNPANGEISLTGLNPKQDVNAPQGSTHFTMRSAWANIDFTNQVASVEYSPVTTLALNTVVSNVVLTPVAAPSGTGTNLLFLQVEFFQQVNGVSYSLNNGSFNALSIVEIL